MSVWRALLSRFVSGFAPSYTDFYDLAYDIQHPAGDVAHQGYAVTDVGQLNFNAAGYVNSSVGIGRVPAAPNTLHVKAATNVNLGIQASGSTLAVSAHNDAVSANVPLMFFGSTYAFNAVPTYASDAAAGTGGLTSGMIYKHSDGSLYIKS